MSDTTTTYEVLVIKKANGPGRFVAFCETGKAVVGNLVKARYYDGKRTIQDYFTVMAVHADPGTAIRCVMEDFISVYTVDEVWAEVEEETTAE